jgi:hypothetical protein
MVNIVYIELTTLIAVSVAASFVGFIVAETFTNAKLDRVTNRAGLKLPFCDLTIPPHTLITFNWGSFGFHIVSEFFMIYLFLSGTDYLPLGLVVLLTRCSNIFVTSYILTHVKNQAKDKELTKLSEDKEVLAENESVFHFEPFHTKQLSAFLLCAALYEVSMLAFLPWQKMSTYLDYLYIIRVTKLFHGFVGTISPIIWLIYSVQSEVASAITIVSLSLAVSFMILTYRIVLVCRGNE